nr:hypothetical protein BaRGS_001678 [Batillaria attramentaria]
MLLKTLTAMMVTVMMTTVAVMVMHRVHQQADVGADEDGGSAPGSDDDQSTANTDNVLMGGDVFIFFFFHFCVARRMAHSVQVSVNAAKASGTLLSLLAKSTR